MMPQAGVYRFTVKDVKKCSIGAIYISVLNLPRERWTILAMVVPGPQEPSELALNRIMEPLVDDLKLRETGVNYFPADDETPSQVHARLFYVAADIPAPRKACGSLGHPATYPCNHCRVDKNDLQKDRSWDWPRKSSFMHGNSGI